MSTVHSLPSLGLQCNIPRSQSFIVSSLSGMI